MGKFIFESIDQGKKIMRNIGILFTVVTAIAVIIVHSIKSLELELVAMAMCGGVIVYWILVGIYNRHIQELHNAYKEE